MKVKELIEKCDVQKVCDYWEDVYNQFDYQDYPSDCLPEFIEYLKTLEPKSINNFKHLVVDETLLDDIDSIDVDVYGLFENDDTRHAMEMSSNEEWLSFEIDNKLDIDNELLLCHILWEMTFFGFDNESRKEVLDDLNERSKEIDKWIEEGTLDEHTVSMEDFKRKFKNES